MREMETTGRTVDEAIAHALNQLGLDRDQVDVDVVTEGKAGFFGIGAEDAIVRVRAKPAADRDGEPGSDSGDRPARRGGGGRRGRGGRRDRDEAQDEPPAETAAAATGDSAPSGDGGGAAAGDDNDDGEGDGGARRRRRGRRGGRRRNREGGEQSQEQPAANETEEPVAAATNNSAERENAGRSDGDDQDNREGGRRRGGRGGGSGRGRSSRGGGGGGSRRETDDARAVSPEPPGQGVPEDEVIRVPGAPDELPTQPPDDTEDELDLAGSSIRDILSLLGLTETEITAREPETPGDGAGLIAQVFDIYGENDDASDDLGLLIGRRGETLGSLQYMVNTIIARGGDDAPVYSIDIEGYRRRREQTLVDLAKEIASEVRETGDVITLEPMPAQERRIVHLALEGEPGVRTESVGSGDRRQVEVMPEDE